MKKLLLLLVIACSSEPKPVSTGCWIGMKNSTRVLIGCMTQQQVVAAEQSSSWQSILTQYSDIKYDANATCETCNQKYGN